MIHTIKHMSWAQFDERRKQTKLAIIPTGAIEEYGPHMPLGTDVIVAEALAERVAQARTCVIAPAIEMGESSSLMCMPGTMALTMDNYKAVIQNEIDLLLGYGFTRLLFINGHGGNTPIITYLAKKAQAEHEGVLCAMADVWPLVEKLGGSVFEHTGAMAHGHAAESNTSIMLHIHPELVDMSKAVKVEPKKRPVPEITSYVKLTDQTPNGVIGDPTNATAEKGKQIMDLCTAKIIEFIDSYFGE
ncbi:MAG: creatininase family protein [Oscillospiraceae bacterium]|nr:creatininase family protein [Oscillospiraceae bacterium]